MKITKKIALLLTLIMIPILLVVCGWTVVLGGMYLFTPAPPQPIIQTGEFPFELTYKLNGELYTVKDVYVCNYEGIGVDEGNGKYRKWSGYIKGSGESAIFVTEDSDRKIFCFVGDAEFYMNDEQYPEERPLTPRLYDVKKNVNIMNSFNHDEIVAIYNVEIVSWKFSEPIDNSFE